MIIIAVFYGVYSVVRDLHGDNHSSVHAATTNALRIIRVERDLRVFREAQIQHVFIHHGWFISIWDDYYGSVHFFAVAGVLIWLFFAQSHRYRFWRNTLALCTAMALIGFAFFPVLPPRLLASSYHFVDTLKVVGGLWNFSSGPANDVSNQFAAMPSLHTAWSTWCAVAFAPSCRHLWAKVALFLYPAATIFCIVVTGNHYFADAAGGLATLWVAYGVTRIGTNLWDRRRNGAPIVLPDH